MSPPALAPRAARQPEAAPPIEEGFVVAGAVRDARGRPAVGVRVVWSVHDIDVITSGLTDARRSFRLVGSRQDGVSAIGGADAGRVQVDSADEDPASIRVRLRASRGRRRAPP